MSDENKVTFDSIFNQDDGLSRRPYIPDAGRVTPVYTSDSVPVPPIHQPATPKAYSPYQYGIYSGAAIPQQLNNNTKKAVNKDKTSFGTKAAVVCLIVMLGFMTLGLGLSFGGTIAKRVLPPERYAINENESSKPEILTYNQPRIEFSESQFKLGGNNVTEIVKQISNAVVSINLKVSVPNFFGQKTEQPGAGSGIIFDEDSEISPLSTLYSPSINLSAVLFPEPLSPAMPVILPCSIINDVFSKTLSSSSEAFASV